MVGGHRWLTVFSKDWQDGPEYCWNPHPNHFGTSRVYQAALLKAGIARMQFDVQNIDSEFERLTDPGVEFSGKPTETGNVKYAIINDNCGNNIQLVQGL